MNFQSERKYLLYLSYAYAFLVTLEHVLRDLYGIATILKPYRILGLVLIAVVFFTKGRSILFHKERDDRYLTWFVLFSGILTFFYIFVGKNINVAGFLNFYTQVVFNLLIFLSLKQINIDHKNLVTLLKFYTGGIVVNAIVMITDYYVRGSDTRVSGFMDNPNSGSFSIIVSILFFILLLRRNSFSVWRLSSWFYLALILMLGLAVFAAGSRTGIVLLAIGITLYVGFVVNLRNFVKFSALVVLAYAAIIIYSTANENSVKNVSGRISSSRFFHKITESEDDIRVFLWKGGIDAFVDSNFMGIGVAQFSSNMSYFKKYMRSYLSEFVRKREIQKRAGLGLHNMYMDVLVEGGVVSLVLLLIYFYKVIRGRILSFRVAKDKDINSFLLSITIVMLLTSLTGYGLLSGAFWFVIFIVSKSYPTFLVFNRLSKSSHNFRA